MNKQKMLATGAILAAILASCNNLSANSTETPLPGAASTPEITSTSEPTLVPTQPPSATPVPPTETSADNDIPLPSGEPLTEWQGIPIMPGAIAGEGDDTAYSYTIDVAIEEIVQFYTDELEKLGWTLLASSEGETNAMIMIFTKGANTLPLTIIQHPEGVMYVMLVK